jgi:uncharacterized protein YkwD
MSPNLPRTPRRSMRRAALLLAVASPVVAGPTAAQAAGTPSVDSREAAVIAPLATGVRLSRAADRHSRRMLRARTLAHQVSGEGAIAGRLRWATGDAQVGETIFWGAGTANSAEIVRAWMDSPGHRDLLLSGGFGTAGIGIRSGGGGVYATVDLASG